MDPFQDPPKNVRIYLGPAAAAIPPGTHAAELFKGPLDGQAVLVGDGAEFGTFEGHPYYFNPALTVTRGREIWSYLITHPVKG